VLPATVERESEEGSYWESRTEGLSRDKLEEEVGEEVVEEEEELGRRAKKVEFFVGDTRWEDNTLKHPNVVSSGTGTE
jgi:hypothetical protein